MYKKACILWNDDDVSDSQVVGLEGVGGNGGVWREWRELRDGGLEGSFWGRSGKPGQRVTHICQAATLSSPPMPPPMLLTPPTKGLRGIIIFNQYQYPLLIELIPLYK